MTEIRSMTESQLMDDDDYIGLYLVAKERIFDHPHSDHYATVYVNRKYLERMGYQRVPTKAEYQYELIRETR